MSAWRLLWLLCCFLTLGLSVHAQTVDLADADRAPSVCAPRIVAIQAARAAAETPWLRPVDGWVDVRLPNIWARRWPDWNGSVWYRIDWEHGANAACATSALPVALGVDGVSITGEVFSNDDLLWRGESLVEPLSRHWNVPNWWILPASGLRPGENSVWIRAVGPASVSAGVGAVRLGDVQSVSKAYGSAQWRQRTVYLINAVLCAMAAALFLLVWGLGWRSSRPQLRDELTQAYGWFGLMALCWLAYLSTYLAPTPWPWPDSITRSRFSTIALIGYALCVCKFTFRFGGQRLPRLEKALYILAVLGCAVVLLPPNETAMQWSNSVWRATMVVFFVNGLQFQWHALRPQQAERKLSHRLLALCWLVYVLIGAATLFSFTNFWQVARYWAALSGLSVIGLVMLLLGGQLVRQMRRMEGFNHMLTERVADARTELAQALAREHAQALENAKLQERIQLAHDLHDGLGGSLVRGMALVEQTKGGLSQERVLSLLKNMRDDLRQLIDQGSSAGATVPQTPVQWIAPLRHRFTSIFDAMGMVTQWSIARLWSAEHRPSVVQCLALTRLLEEALSNVIKHSQAQQVLVSVELGEELPSNQSILTIRIEDNGRGFDVAAVQGAGLSVGMRSMAERAKRIGAQLQVLSEPGRTVVSIRLALGATC